MNMELEPFMSNELTVHNRLLEALILDLGDDFSIRIVWDGDTALLTGAFAIAGGLLGGYAGGRFGAALGAGIGSVTGLGVSTVISLRELWSKVKAQLQELMYIVLNFLRRLDAVDYLHAAELLLTTYNSRKELVISIVSFLAHKLGREVLSSIES